MASSKTPFAFPPMAGEARKPQYPVPQSTLGQLQSSSIRYKDRLSDHVKNESKLTKEKFDLQISNIDDCLHEAQDVCERVQQSSTPEAFEKEIDDMVDSIRRDVDRLNVKIYRLCRFGDGTLPGQMEEMKKRMKKRVDEFGTI